jgi:hypothetical protein
MKPLLQAVVFVFVVRMLLLAEGAEAGIGSDETAAGVEVLVVRVLLLAVVIGLCSANGCWCSGATARRRMVHPLAAGVAVVNSRPTSAHTLALLRSPELVLVIALKPLSSGAIYSQRRT